MSYDQMGRLDCTAVRMNPAVYGNLPASACTQGTAGSNGPDRITRNIYDAAGQLLQVREGVGTALERVEATYSYTANGRKEYVLDANGNRARFEYDGFDRLTKWTFPSTARPSSYNDSTQANALATAGSLNTADYEQYGYDANGNRTSLRKRDGSTLTYSYDALNRMTVKVVPSRAGLTAAQTRDVYYDYDLRGLMTKARFDSLAGEGVTSTYNGFGELASASISMGGVTRTLGYTYDKASRRVGLTHADGQMFTYVRDSLGRPSSIYEGPSVSASTQLAQASFDNRGLLASYQRSAAPNAFVTGYTWDPIGRLTSLANDAAGTANDLTISQGFNPASQIISQTRSNDAYAWTGSVNVNRSYTTNGLNQYTAAGPASFTYDANGNLTSDGSTTFLYDIENRLVSASGARTAGLTWDPMGRLWQVTGATTDTRFLYDGDELVAEYDSAGTMARRYVHSDNADDPVVQYDSASVGASYRTFLMPDERGSIVGLIYDNGTSRAINAYDEYGIPGSANQGRFQYTGQAWLPELGMYHYKARIYSPTLGRFLQTDPIGYDDQINLYAYVANDPMNKGDFSGQRQGPLYVDVHIWRSKSNQWGHAMTTLHGSTKIVYTNQWPGGEGVTKTDNVRPNEQMTYQGAVNSEGRKPDIVFTIQVPNRGEFLKAAAEETAKNRWAAVTGLNSDSTNCTVSTSNALNAGGVNLPGVNFTPDQLEKNIQQLPKDPNGVRQPMPPKQPTDYEKCVAAGHCK